MHPLAVSDAVAARIEHEARLRGCEGHLGDIVDAGRGDEGEVEWLADDEAVEADVGRRDARVEVRRDVPTSCARRPHQESGHRVKNEWMERERKKWCGRQHRSGHALSIGMRRRGVSSSRPRNSRSKPGVGIMRGVGGGGGGAGGGAEASGAGAAVSMGAATPSRGATASGCAEAR